MNRLETLNVAERQVVVAAINRFGGGQHPVADDNNLLHFRAAYVAECLENAIPHFVIFHARVARRVLMRLASK